MIIASQHQIHIPVRKILVIQLGDIGDVIWSIPTFWALKETFPRAGLFVLLRKHRGDFLLDDAHIENIFIVEEGSLCDSLKLVKKIRGENFDLLFDLRADDRGAYLALFSGAKIKAAQYYPGIPWRNRFFTHLVKEVPAAEKSPGAAQQSLKIVHGFGIQESTAVPKVFVAEEARKTILERLAREKIPLQNGLVTINPFSRWSYKEWPMDRWRRLSLWIWRRYQMPVILTGSPAERGRADALAAGTDGLIFNFAGKTTLREMAALLEKSSLHLGVDSAAPHMAAAVGVPTVTLYGPSDWREWAFPGEQNRVVVPDMDCVPCCQKGCNGQGRSVCLENLPVERVQAVVMEIFKDRETL
jgi:heptosyltransferase-3